MLDGTKIKITITNMEIEFNFHKKKSLYSLLFPGKFLILWSTYLYILN